MGTHGLKGIRQRRNDALAAIDWQAFERLVAQHYRNQGYRVEHVGTAQSGTRFDGGIDLKLHRGDEYIVVQCKHWNAFQVPHNDVHELLGIMQTERASGAIFVTSGEFTSAARRKTHAIANLELIDGAMLRAMLGPLGAELDTVVSGHREGLQHDGVTARSRAQSSHGGGLLLAPLAFERTQRDPTPGIVAAALALAALLAGHHAWQRYFRVLPHAAHSTSAMTVHNAARRAAPALTQTPAHSDVRAALTEATREPEPTARQRQPTPAEIRESQRKADEAMRVLAPYVAEM